MIDNDGFCQQIRGLEDAMYALAYSIIRKYEYAYFGICYCMFIV